MPAPARVVLGGATLNRKWWVDVNTGTYAAPTWTPVGGISEVKTVYDNTMKDDADMDSGGAQSEAATAYKWGVECKLQRKETAASRTVYDPGQEAIRTAAALLSPLNQLDIRYYEMTTGGPKVEAYRGYVVANWSPEGGDMTELDKVAVVLSGRGARTAITHPDGAAVVPVLYSVDPATAGTAGGSLHTLRGTGFFAAGVADVQSMKIGVTNVPTFVVHSDNELVWLSPAKVAGPFVVYVTNTVGESVTATVTVTYS